MAHPNDPEFIDSLQRIFMSRSDMRSVIDYQQKLFNNLQALEGSHRAVHEHVRKLTESHNRVQDDTNELVRARNDAIQALGNLDRSHQQIQRDIREAMSVINYMQQEVRKVGKIEERLGNLEREFQKVQQEERKDDRKDDEQDQRIKKLEQRKHIL